jgi:hypothetical protein
VRRGWAGRSGHSPMSTLTTSPDPMVSHRLARYRPLPPWAVPVSMISPGRSSHSSSW